MRTTKIEPFAKNIPTIFAVGSPFQALCAIEAIRDFQISDYIFFAVVNRNNRDDQMIAVLDLFNIEYIIVDKYIEIYPWLQRLLAIKRNRNHYKRGFVGSYFSGHLYIWLMRNISDNAVIVSLDDGNNTVSLLTEKWRKSSKNKFSFFNDFLLRISSWHRGIQIRKHLYTIYSDIENNKFICKENTFTHIFPEKTKCDNKGIFFIGTNPPSFRSQMGITREQYIMILRMIFKYISTKYQGETLYYIPHGMDNEQTTIELCNNYNLNYQRPSTVIELFMCNLTYSPKCVLGFSSSALFNIKKMHPYIDVQNVLIENKGIIKEPYKTFSEYYAQNGICTLKIQI